MNMNMTATRNTDKMSFTVESWKEKYTYPKQNSIIPHWINAILLRTESYSVLFRHREIDDGSIEYITGYVKLTPPLKTKYQWETMRTNNIIGIDTYDNSDFLLDDQKAIAKSRIIAIIKEHHNL